MMEAIVVSEGNWHDRPPARGKEGEARRLASPDVKWNRMPVSD